MLELKSALGGESIESLNENQVTLELKWQWSFDIWEIRLSASLRNWRPVLYDWSLMLLLIVIKYITEYSGVVHNSFICRWLFLWPYFERTV